MHSFPSEKQFYIWLCLQHTQKLQWLFNKFWNTDCVVACLRWVLQLWSRIASSIWACIPSCQKCWHLGQHFSSKEWKTSNEPVWWKPVNFLMSHSSVSCSTILRNAFCATLLGRSHFLMCSSSGDSVGCAHFGNNELGLLSHSWPLDILYGVQ